MNNDAKATGFDCPVHADSGGWNNVLAVPASLRPTRINRRPSKKHERIPKFARHFSFGKIYFVNPSHVTIINEVKIRLPPIQCCFHDRTPGPSQAEIERDIKAMFMPIPHFTGQKPASYGQETRLEPSIWNLALRRQRENAVEDDLIERRDAHIERCQHTCPVCLNQTVLTQICFKVGAHERVGVKGVCVTPCSSLPWLKIVLNFCRNLVRRLQQLPKVLAKER